MLSRYQTWIAATQEENVNACIRENWISSQGCFIDTFENRLTAKLAEHNLECGACFNFPPMSQRISSWPDERAIMFSKYLNLQFHYATFVKIVSKIKEAINEFSS